MNNKSYWSIEYDNDVGANDECFEEWWGVVNNESGMSFRCDSEVDAEWLLQLLLSNEAKQLKT